MTLHLHAKYKPSIHTQKLVQVISNQPQPSEELKSHTQVTFPTYNPYHMLS